MTAWTSSCVMPCWIRSKAGRFTGQGQGPSNVNSPPDSTSPIARNATIHFRMATPSSPLASTTTSQASVPSGRTASAACLRPTGRVQGRQLELVELGLERPGCCYPHCHPELHLPGQIHIQRLAERCPPLAVVAVGHLQAVPRTVEPEVSRPWQHL